MNYQRQLIYRSLQRYGAADRDSRSTYILRGYMADTISDFIKRDKERLTKEREAALQQRHAIDQKIAEIDREFQAIAAYEQVKLGKPARQARTTDGTGKRGKRTEILNVIKGKSDGFTRSELLEHLRAKGDKKQEATISAALYNLTKQKQLKNKEGRYTAA